MPNKKQQNNLKKVEEFATDFVKNQSENESLLIIYSNNENIIKVNSSKPANVARNLYEFLKDNADIALYFSSIMNQTKE